MLCFLELGMSIWGIVVLVQQKLQFTKTRVVTGVPAIIAGLILMSTLPLLLTIGFTVGVVLTMNNGGRPVSIVDYPALLLVDLGGLALVIGAVGAIAAVYGRDPRQLPDQLWGSPGTANQPLPPPADPSNPYSPPHLR
jgi:hypothetical protein